MATKSGVAQPPKKRPARRSQRQKNYLIVAGDGSLYLASGATGKVSIVDGESQKIDKGSKDKTFTLKASKDAKEVKDHKVMVTGTFKDIKVNESFMLTVKK